MRALAPALTLLVGAPCAVQATVDAISTDELIEDVVRADFNGDGLEDTATILRDGKESRILRVVTSYRSETDFGENPPQVLALDPYPLGDSALKVTDSTKGKVLVMDDLTGGTTAVASTHRFRWDAKLGAMRLIGLDATLYSRTYAHDGKEASWNLMTGDLVTRRLKLGSPSGDAAYTKLPETRTKKPSPPVRLEDSPSGDDLLEWPGAK